VNRFAHRLSIGLVLAATFVVVAPSAATAQDPSPIAAYRQSLMQAFRTHMGGVRAAVDGTAPAGHAVHHAEAFNHMAIALANAFPEGSEGPGSRALPAIWENRMDFMDKVSEIQSATAALVAAAESGDEGRIEAALGTVQGTCAGCHQPYRAR
jgi:cytochrome c556